LSTAPFLLLICPHADARLTRVFRGRNHKDDP
jgi:hypothetical protein